MTDNQRGTRVSSQWIYALIGISVVSLGVYVMKSGDKTPARPNLVSENNFV
jgi:hypothetical protein